MVEMWWSLGSNIGFLASSEIGANNSLPPTLITPSLIIGFNLMRGMELCPCIPFSRLFISAGKLFLWTTATVRFLAFSRSPMDKRFCPSSGWTWFLSDLIQSTNFSTQATLRRVSIQQEDLLTSSSTTDKASRFIWHNSFLISRWSSAWTSNLSLDHSSSGFVKKCGPFIQRSFFRNLSISIPRLTSSAGFNLVGQCLHCSGWDNYLISVSRLATNVWKRRVSFLM